MDLGEGVYVVRTQAGFKKIIKLYRKYIDDYQLMGTPGNIPKKYPCIVKVRKEFVGHCQYYTDNYDITEYYNLIQTQLCDTLNKIFPHLPAP